MAGWLETLWLEGPVDESFGVRACKLGACVREADCCSSPRDVENDGKRWR